MKGRGLSFNLRVYIPPFCGMLDHPKIFECFSDCFLFFQWALWLSGILGLRQIIVLTTLPPHFRLICEIYRLDTFNPLCVFIHSIKFLISFITSPFLILYNATNKDRIVTIIMIHCSFMFDSLLLYSAASFNSFRILSICTFVSLILLDIPSRLLDDLFLI